ncbi:MAG TPA: tetratricopeptide repeat protein [Candidatus Sulfotelmatobacter sp.]|nr:tetratricopeptide repeat protein [Candidatus Sulfotelmatobacter sp.]
MAEQRPEPDRDGDPDPPAPASSARGDGRHPATQPGGGDGFVGILPAAGVSAALAPILHVGTEDGTGLKAISATEFGLASMYLAGVRQCLVVVSAARPDLPSRLGNGSDPDMTLGYLVQPTPRGLADAVDTTYPWLGGRNCCLVLANWVVNPPDALDRVCRHLTDSGADLVLGVFAVADPSSPGAVRTAADGRVLAVHDPANGAPTNGWGVAAWSPAFSDYIHRRLAADGPDRHPGIGTLFQRAIEDGLHVRAVTFADGECIDAATPQGLKRLVAAWTHPDGDAAPPPTADALLDTALASLRALDLAGAAAALDDLQALQREDGALRILRAALAMRRGLPDDARRLVEEGPLAVPDPARAEPFGEPSAVADALATLGGLVSGEGARDRATLLCRAALALAPEQSSAHRLLARLALEDRRFDEALAHCWHVVELAPNDPAALSQLGAVLFACGHRDDARHALERAVRLDPECATAHRQLGRLFAEADEAEPAEDHLQRAIMFGHPDVDSMRRLGWLLQHTNRLERAEAIARLAVTTAPDDAAAHHLLGWVMKRRGRTAEARAVLERAVALQPDFPIAVRLLVELDLALGSGAEAAARLHAALARTPHDPDLNQALAWLLLERRDLAGAEAAARRAVAGAPDRPDALRQLAWVLLERGAHDDAAGICVALLSHRPDDPDAHGLMGELHLRQGRYDLAERWLRQALAHDARSAQLLRRLGWLLLRLERLDEADAMLRRALDADADLTVAAVDLAQVLDRRGRFGEAEALLRAIVARKPGEASSRLALGRLLVNAERDDEAAAALAEAAAIDDCPRETWWQLVRLASRGVPAARQALAALVPSQRRDRFADTIDAAIGWLALDEYQAIVAHALAEFPDDDLLQAAHQFGLVYDQTQTAEDLRHAADRFGASVPASPRRTPSVGRRPRIAYVGNWLHRELMDGYIGFHDHDRFEISLFTDADPAMLPRRDARLSVYRLDGVDLAQACATMDIDLVIDVVGPYPRAELFGPFRALRRRVAPVQCLWLNCFSTTGSPAYDYLIADGHLIQPGEERWFSEHVLRMPHSQWFWTPPHELASGALPALANGYVTFGSTGRGLKLNDAVLNLWAEVLAQLPASRLRLLGWHIEDWRLRRRILTVFADHGVAAERIDFLSHVEKARLPEFHRSIDLSLDTFPFNGGMTSFEALWMGVPVVTLDGERFTARQTAMILHGLGLGEWVARDDAGFVALATDLARDVDRLTAARASLRERMRASPLCDGPGFARALEALFVEMLDGR